MAITKFSGRQEVISAKVDFGFADLESGSFEQAIDLPTGAIVVGGQLVVTEAFDSGTSDAADVGDADTGDRYADGVDLQSTGLTALTPTGFVYSPAKPVGVTIVGKNAGELIAPWSLAISQGLKMSAISVEITARNP